MRQPPTRQSVRCASRSLVRGHEPSLAGSHRASIAPTYEILTPGRLFRNRKLMRAGVKERGGKEAIMLDLAFVALGLAVLALMGVYALALGQL